MSADIQRTFHEAFGRYEPREQKLWFADIARLMGIKPSRAEHLYREYTYPTGPEIILLDLYASGQISLSTTIRHNLNRVERKYHDVKRRRP